MEQSGQSDINGRLYRLKIVDLHGSSYTILGSKNDLRAAIDWLEAGVGEWLRLSGVNDEAERKPYELIVGREAIAGMLLAKV